MSLSLREIADLIDGQLVGDGEILISGAETIRDAGPQDITLADDAKFASKLKQSKAAAVVVDADFQPVGIPTITVEDVHVAFQILAAHFRPPRERGRCGVSAHAHISPTATIANDVDIYPGAYVDSDVDVGEGSTIHSGSRILAGTRIGANVTILPNVVIYEDTVIGDRSTIHSGTVIGCYGFGYSTKDGRHHLCAQLGNVEIGSDVEIGAGTTIDRGTYSSTKIGDGTKIDNQVHIAHNCRIGRHNLLCAQVGLAGSCSTGDYVVMAGQVGVADHLHIGDQAVLCAKTGVINDVPGGEMHFGIPGTPRREKMLQLAAIGKLPEMRKRLKELERRLDAIDDQQSLSNKPEAA